MMHEIFDNLFDGIFIIDKSYQVLYCNNAGANLCGSSPRQIIGKKNFLDLLIFDKDYRAQIQDLNAIDYLPYKELLIKNCKNNYFNIQISFQFHSTNQWIVFCRDVSLETKLHQKYRNNHLLTALINSLNDAFLIFNVQGQGLDVFSKSCYDVLGFNPEGKYFWDIIKAKKFDSETTKLWFEAVFEESVSFADLKSVAPLSMKLENEKYLNFDYYPIRDLRGKVQFLVTVASDITDLKLAQKVGDEEKQNAARIINILTRKSEVKSFIRDVKLYVNQLEKNLSLTQPETKELMRILHTLKGCAGLFAMNEIVEECHLAEEVIIQFNNQNINYDQLKKEITSHISQIQSHLQNFSHKVKEILGIQNLKDDSTIEVSIDTSLNFFHTISTYLPEEQKIEFIKNYLSTPIENYFLNYDEMLQETALNLDKKINPIKIINGHIPVCTMTYKPLLTSLVHAFKNAIAHGIEDPSKRLKNGKSEYGNIEIHFEVVQDKLFIILKDDGSGINIERLRKSFEKKMKQNFDHLSESDLLKLLLSEGTSTNDKADFVSGRGIGLDIITREVSKLGGQIWISSKEHNGSELCLQVPYSFHLGSSDLEKPLKKVA